MSGGIAVPVGAGLAVGIFLISLMLTWDQNLPSPDNSGSVFKVDSNACGKPFTQRADLSQTTYQNGTVISTTNFPIFLLKTGSISKVCIRYTSGYSEYAGNTYSGKDSPIVTAGSGSSSAINVTATSVARNDHYFLNQDLQRQNRSSFNIAYTISTTSISTGFYGIWTLDQCPGLHFAVGHNASEIDYSRDFAWQIGGYYCPAGYGLDKQVVGLSNVDVMYVTNQTTGDIGVNMTHVDSSVSETSLANDTVRVVTFHVHFRTYNGSYSVIADGRDFAFEQFSGNPIFKKTGQCSWDPTDESALQTPNGQPIDKNQFNHNGKYIRIYAKAAVIPAYTNDSIYSFSIELRSLPAGYYALQPEIFITSQTQPVDAFGVSSSGENNFAGQGISDYFPIIVKSSTEQSSTLSDRENAVSTPTGEYGKC